jgi:tRNA (guanine37-N1)-methyltransferase
VIVRLSDVRESAKKKFARALMKEMRNVKCVYEQEGGIEGELRLRKLHYLAGERRTVTLHKENGCSFRVDVAKCYFSPRLSTERLRIANEVQPAESVLNMFAGVGPFSIPIAKKKRAKVMSCELGKVACELHLENNRLNKVGNLVKVVQADANQLPQLTRRRFDRILMPHPSESPKFLRTALELAKRRAVIHYYRHLLGRNEEEASEKLIEELTGLLPGRAHFKPRRVREVGPRWIEMAADIRLP